MTNALAQIEKPDPSTLGPAMRQLTEKQQLFVIALLMTGGGQTKAASMAGYSDVGNLQAVMGHHNMRNDKILAAINEETAKRLNAGTMLGASVLIEIAADVNHKDRFKAASALLDRGGLMQVQKIEVAHTVENITRHENEAAIIKMAKARGEDPAIYLEYDPGEVIDAEVTEVAEEEIEW